MPSVFDDLAELLPEVALDVGRAAKSIVEDATSEARKLLRPEKLKPLLADFRLAPTIPVRHQFGVNFAEDGFIVLNSYQCYRAYQQFGLQPVTVGLAGLQAALHFNPGGYRLTEYGLNARRLVQHQEWYRLLSSPVLHSSLPHLACNIGSLMTEGSELERRIGSRAMLGTLASITALSQGIYVAGCWMAAKLSDQKALVVPYYHNYAVGFSGVVFGLQALNGYLREADRGGLVEEEYPYTHGRYRCWLQLGLTHVLVPEASLWGHVAGIMGGLLVTYLPQAWSVAWRRVSGRRPPQRLQAGVLGRHRTRWWRDLLGHLVIGGGTVLVIVMRRRHQQSLAR